MPQLLGIAWDLDGTLANTEELKLAAHKAAVKSLSGTWRLHPGNYQTLLGQSSRQVVTGILQACDLIATYDRYKQLYSHFYTGSVPTQARAYVGVLALLTDCHVRGLKQIIVSSSSAANVKRVLEVTGIGDLVPNYISGDSMHHAHHKPHPTPYQLALRHLELGCGNVVAVEDTTAGCESARAAGLKVVAIQHQLNGYQNLAADRIVGTEAFASTLRFRALLLEALGV